MSEAELREKPDVGFAAGSPITRSQQGPVGITPIAFPP